MENPSTTHKVFNITLAILFTVAGAWVIYDTVLIANKQDRFQKHLQEQVSCNSELLEALKTRGSARLRIWDSENASDLAVIAMLEDIQKNGGPLSAGDAHLHSAIDELRKSVDTRNNPDLAEPYPDCSQGYSE